MMHSKGPHLSTAWVTPLLVALAIATSIAARYCFAVPTQRAVVLLVNMVGTIIFASAFEVPIPKYGDGGWLDSLKFAIKELPNYRIAPSFSISRFYLGLLVLLCGMAAAAVTP